MDNYATPPRTAMQPCRACGRKLHRPIWRRVDHDEYEVLCDICTYMADAQFTPELAITQAVGIVYFTAWELAQRGAE